MELGIRRNSAYYENTSVAVGDVDTIEIELHDLGKIKHKAVLLANGKSYAFNGNKLSINKEDVDGVLVAELQDVDEITGKVLQRWSCEQLFVLPISKDGEDTLITERLFYKKYIANLLQVVNKLEQRVAVLEKQNYKGLCADVESLKNGRFRVLKF